MSHHIPTGTPRGPAQLKNKTGNKIIKVSFKVGSSCKSCQQVTAVSRGAYHGIKLMSHLIPTGTLSPAQNTNVKGTNRSKTEVERLKGGDQE